ncbi:MAG: hypothetical protein KAJ86_00355 [Alphaproteobacteria bacterium]|nr:hypothetical protein [Alphaproteobacteria bacterium]
MLEQINSEYPLLNTQRNENNNAITKTKKVLRMVKNERMGGMVPKWETITISDKQALEKNLEQIQSQKHEDSFEKILLSYQSTETTQIEKIKESHDEFGFGDLIDMINPLHHIPIVNHIYQGLTGDEIKPVGRIIGGALFGGAVGAASGLVNVIIEEETGKDVADNAIAVAFKYIS